jgi:hypothetical protein
MLNIIKQKIILVANLYSMSDNYLSEEEKGMFWLANTHRAMRTQGEVIGPVIGKPKYQPGACFF